VELHERGNHAVRTGGTGVGWPGRWRPGAWTVTPPDRGGSQIRRNPPISPSDHWGDDPAL